MIDRKFFRKLGKKKLEENFLSIIEMITYFCLIFAILVYFVRIYFSYFVDYWYFFCRLFGVVVVVVDFFDL